MSIGEVIGFVAHFSRPGDPPIVRAVSLGAFERSTLSERARNLKTVLRDLTGREPGPEAVSELQRLLGRASIKLLPIEQGLRTYQPGAAKALEVLVEAGHVASLPKSFQALAERSPDVAPDFGANEANDEQPPVEIAVAADPEPVPTAVLADEGDGIRSQLWPLLSSAAAAILLAAMILAPRFGIELSLFGRDADILHGAVVVGLCIVGAAVLAVRLQGMLADRRDIESTERSLATARLEAARISRGLGYRDAASGAQREEAESGYASPGG
ncbi:hypothetical protein SLT36_22055 [Aminobacter sp. BA135]|uniref:hypothetical protein n=1 Tax=Aminobacter sp. BA135 TaxID=537596 RepID=UPI003D798487